MKLLNLSLLKLTLHLAGGSQDAAPQNGELPNATPALRVGVSLGLVVNIGCLPQGVQGSPPQHPEEPGSEVPRNAARATTRRALSHWSAVAWQLGQRQLHFRTAVLWLMLRAMRRWRKRTRAVLQSTATPPEAVPQGVHSDGAQPQMLSHACVQVQWLFAMCSGDGGQTPRSDWTTLGSWRGLRCRAHACSCGAAGMGGGTGIYGRSARVGHCSAVCSICCGRHCFAH